VLKELKVQHFLLLVHRVPKGLIILDHRVLKVRKVVQVLKEQPDQQDLQTED
jgi:hypothetical protein